MKRESQLDEIQLIKSKLSKIESGHLDSLVNLSQRIFTLQNQINTINETLYKVKKMTQIESVRRILNEILYKGKKMTQIESVRRTLASQIAKREGKKHQASVADIREILRILIAIDAENRIECRTSVLSQMAGEALHLAQDPKFIKKYEKSKDVK